MSDLSQEQIVLRGNRAGHLLSSPDFMGFMRELQTDLLTCIGESSPEHHKERTSLYYQFHGLKELLERFNTYKQAGEQIIAQDASTNGPSSDTETDTD
jgi:hypothetical protein